MNSKHTPGPWKMQKTRFGQIEIWAKVDLALAIVKNIHFHTTNFSELEANAKLISAAPDMLEALKEAEIRLSEYVDDVDDEEDGDAITLKTIREAIAKAEG